MSSAKGAAFTTRLGQRPRVDASSTTTSAEGAIQFGRHSFNRWHGIAFGKDVFAIREPPLTRVALSALVYAHNQSP